MDCPVCGPNVFHYCEWEDVKKKELTDLREKLKVAVCMLATCRDYLYQEVACESQHIDTDDDECCQARHFAGSIDGSLKKIRGDGPCEQCGDDGHSKNHCKMD